MRLINSKPLNEASRAIFTALVLMLCQACDNPDPVDPIMPGNISTIAGVAGEFDYAGDGGPAISAKLGYIVGLAIDDSGNIYFVDGAANVVRKIDRTSGVISTLGGTFLGFNVIDPTPYKGDGGPAVEAHFNVPLGIAVDASGNIYIADSGNNVVRRISASTGVITTIAGNNNTLGYDGDGGLATAAHFYTPYDVATDQAGNIYITDSQNHSIRKITLSTGIISTVAGSGPDHKGFGGDNGLATEAHLDTPQGIALDDAGNLFIVDAGNHAVRKVAASTGIITTIAGTGNHGYDGDGGLGTLARLYAPSRVAVDDAGDIYIADQGSHVVRKVSGSTGIITTLAGTGTAGYSGDGGPAVSATLSSPQGVAVDDDGNVIFTESGNSVIRAVRQN